MVLSGRRDVAETSAMCVSRAAVCAEGCPDGLIHGIVPDRLVGILAECDPNGRVRMFGS